MSHSHAPKLCREITDALKSPTWSPSSPLLNLY